MVTADGRPDWPWIIALITLTALVVGAYAKTFIFWRRSFLEVEPPDRNRKLMELAWVFAMCAICGYVMSIVSFVWPAYRLLTVLMAVLVFCSWKFAWSLSDFRVSFSARRFERQLRESLNHRAEELEVLVSQRTRELEDARREADAASVAKTAFLANMSHEIRTPMTAILGFSELLRSEDLDAEEKSEYLDLVHRHGEHLLAVINDILDLSKIEAGEITLEHIACDPGVIVKDVCSLLRHRAQGKSVDLVVELPPSFPSAIRTDPTRLKQVLLNLVGNAVKFTQMGSVRVVCRAGRAGEREAEETPTIAFEVRDTGIGIGPEQLQSLFRPFTQADASTTRRFGGTGLGLAISRHLTHALGGELRVTSEPGKGSTFTLIIPAPPAEHATIVTDAGESIEAPREFLRSSDRILLADDSPDNRRLISRILEKAGATVDVVSNGREAVDALHVCGSGPCPYSLVLMDVDMPVLDGICAAKEIREHGIRIPLIAITAHAMATDAQRCLKGGFNGHMAKPVDRRALIQTCVAAIRGNDPQNKTGDFRAEAA